MVEYGPRHTNEEVRKEVYVPPQTPEIPEPRKPEHDSNPTDPNRYRKIARNVIATLTGVLVLGGGVAFAKVLTSREANNLPPRNPEQTVGASPFPSTGEAGFTPTPERQAKNYKFDANTRVFAADNMQSFMEVQSRFNIDRGVAPSERVATMQFPSLLQNAANINTRKGYKASSGNSKTEKREYPFFHSTYVNYVLFYEKIKED